MLTTAAAAIAVAAHPFVGWGFPWFAIFIPLFWIAIIVLFVTLGRRRWRHGGGWGPYGYAGPWAQAVQASRNAESTLAERFANGDIDEKEYRARLEVLRVNAPQPPIPPTK